MVFPVTLIGFALTLWFLWGISRNSVTAAREANLAYKRLQEIDRPFGQRLYDFTIKLDQIEASLFQLRHGKWPTHNDDWEARRQEYLEAVRPADMPPSGNVERIDWDDIRWKLKRRGR